LSFDNGVLGLFSLTTHKTTLATV